MSTYWKILKSGARISVVDGKYDRKQLERLTVKELTMLLLDQKGVKSKLVDLLMEVGTRKNM